MKPAALLWQAVQARDHQYDNDFVFGVYSTKIYCRPSCPSKHPKSIDKIVFFSKPAGAEAAGFRACLRCNPKSDDETISASQRRRVEEACKYIDQNLDAKVSLKTLSELVGMSQFHLQRTFKRLVGITPRQYAEASKMKRIKLHLKGGESVRRSVYKVGYNSTSWLYSQSTKDKFGMSPSNYKNGGADMQIYYSLAGCKLGRLLVAGTERGICAVSLGDEDEKLESFLFDEYPRAEVKKDTNGDKIGKWLEEIVEYLEGEKVVHLNDLPLDIQATAFQYRVWKELQSIPYGSTRSYSEIARRISHPKAVRAVANACAGNPVPLVVPCHRVIREDGSLGGYALGIERKESLLEMEEEKSRKVGFS